MEYYLEISPIQHDPIFRLQKDNTWRKVEARQPLHEYDFTTPVADQIVALQRNDISLTIDGKKWRVSPTSGSALILDDLYYTAYLSRSGDVPTPTFEQLLDAIAKGNDKRSHRLVLTVYGQFELRPIHDEPSVFKDPMVVVRYESFISGGGYVGKEAARDIKFFKAWYRDGLEIWIHHLRTGQTNLPADANSGRSLDDVESELLTLK